MNKLFIDTGAFIAKYLARDHFHDEAIGLWSVVEAKANKIFTSNFVLDETFTLLARRANYRFSAKVARALYASDILTILRPTLETELRALNLLEKYADQNISFTDCISFQLMKEHNIEIAFSFDKHFGFAGFDKLA